MDNCKAEEVQRAPKFVYKYNSGTDYDIDAIKNDYIWVPNIYELNDPIDYAFYVDINKAQGYDFGRLKHFQTYIVRPLLCLSLAKNRNNRVLWNYYTNGFRGLVLKYKLEDVLDAIRKEGLSYLNENVHYGEETENLTKMYLEYERREPIGEYVAVQALFRKHTSWEREGEYRISISTPSDYSSEDKGIKLYNVVPVEVIVGYKMDYETKEILRKNCNDKNIEIKEYRPVFNTPDMQFEFVNINL